MDQYLDKSLNGRYEITELIGIGGMANVYRAIDNVENRVVAVKILREEFLDNEEFVRRFKNESKAIAVLSHPNIVKVFDVSFTSKHQFIVMELVDGITLKEYIMMQGTVNWKEVVHFTTEVLKALEHAHSKGIVHRDIKPHNIMLLPDGSIKVMDFGIARFARIETGITTNKAMGSVHYISPEQAKGDHTGVTTDIYSTGIMMFEMLTGQLPFEADTPISVAIKQISDNPRRPREINPSIPEGLEEIVIRAMQKDPLRRYPSANAMLSDLNEFKKNPSILFEYQYMSPERISPYYSALEKKTAMVQQKQREANPAGEAGRQKKQTKKKKPAKVKAGKKKRGSYEDNDVYYDDDPYYYDEDEIQEEEVKSSLIPIMTGVGLAFIFFAIAAVVIFLVIMKPFQKTSDIPAPNVIGLYYDDVLKDPAYENIKFELIERVETAEYQPGQIIFQDPEAGGMIKEEGGLISVKIANDKSAPAGDKVPNLVSMTQEEAVKALEAMGLTSKIVEFKSGTIAKGLVAQTEPKFGEAIPESKEVTLHISTGEAESAPNPKVPDIVGMETERAKAKLEEAGLKLGTVKEIDSDRPKGVVVTQDPAKDGEVAPGTAINVEVSNAKGQAYNFQMTFALPLTIDDAVYVEIVVDDQVVAKRLLNPSTAREITETFKVIDGSIVEAYIDGKPFKGYKVTFDENGKETLTLMYDNIDNY